MDDAAMKDYVVNHDVNHFGKDKGGTKGVVEIVPFVVQTTATASFVNIGIVSGGHGTHVAGTVAGQGLLRRPVRRRRAERAARGRPRLPVHHGLLHLGSGQRVHVPDPGRPA